MDFDPHGDPAMPSVGTESQNPGAGHGEKAVHNNAVSVRIPREILKMKQKTARNRKPTNENRWSISVSTDNITGDELLLHFDAIINSVSICTFRREIINSTLVAFSTEEATPVNIIKLKEAGCC